MNKILISSALLMAAVAISSSLGAQSSRTSRENEKHIMLSTPQWIIQLLKSELVRKEIELTDEQETKIKSVEVEHNAALQAWGNAAMQERVLGSQKPPVDGTKNTLEEAIAPSRQRLQQILLPRQLVRLDEISNQLLGPDLFDLSDSPEIAKQLDLSREQMSKIDAILGDRNKAVDKLNDEVNNSYPMEESKSLELTGAFLDQRWVFDRSVLDKIVKILTPPQRKQLAQMNGNDIDTRKLTQQCYMRGSWTQRHDNADSGISTGPAFPTIITRDPR